MKTSERNILLGLAEMWERNSKAESQDGPATGNSKNMVRLLALQLRHVVEVLGNDGEAKFTSEDEQSVP